MSTRKHTNLSVANMSTVYAVLQSEGLTFNIVIEDRTNPTIVLECYLIYPMLGLSRPLPIEPLPGNAIDDIQH